MLALALIYVILCIFVILFFASNIPLEEDVWPEHVERRKKQFRDAPVVRKWNTWADAELTRIEAEARHEFGSLTE